MLKEPIAWFGTGVGGTGVAVGKKVEVGESGWKGVAVAVAFVGLNRKFGFMPTATGALAWEDGKLQAEINTSSASRTKGSFFNIRKNETRDLVSIRVSNRISIWFYGGGYG